MTTTQPNEPTGPSPHRARYRPAWVAMWVAFAVVGTVVLGVLWARGTRVELLALVGAFVATCTGVALYHLVVTLDIGERTVARDRRGARAPLELLPRRHLLVSSTVGVLTLVAGALGLRWYGRTRPAGSAWSSGSRLITISGGPLRPDDVPLGGVVTVWPEGSVGTERAAVMVIRLREGPVPPTDLGGVVDGALVAYSRLCTHAGCAVALYRSRDQALFCPCHQATFDARRGAIPTGGPASVALPQLPMTVGPDGVLVATGDLSRPPGPVGAEVDR